MKFNSLLTLGMSLVAASAFAGSPGKAPAVVQPVVAEEQPLGFTLSAGYDSHYIFRGVLFAENLVSTAIDGTIPLTDMLSLNVGVWFATSADDSGRFGNGGSYHELDLYGALLVDLGPVTVGAKYTHYFFDGTSTENGAVNDVNEIGLIATSTIGPIDVIAGAYYDDETDGFYFETGISHTFVVTDRISIVPAALISFADDYYGVNGFNHVKVGVSVPIKLTKTATLTPYIAGNIPIDSLEANGEDDQLYGGVSLSVSF
jgi:hypothetical protein